jgi:hypothetical protein
MKYTLVETTVGLASPCSEYSVVRCLAHCKDGEQSEILIDTNTLPLFTGLMACETFVIYNRFRAKELRIGEQENIAPRGIEFQMLRIRPQIVVSHRDEPQCPLQT